MEKDCRRTTDDLWDHARLGTDPSPDVAAHISTCEDCRRTADEVSRIACGLRAVYQTTDRPDCRSLVAARIAGERRKPASVLRYAIAAAIALASVLASWLFTAQRSSSPEKTTHVAAVSHAAPLRESHPKIPDRVVRPQTVASRPSGTRERRMADIGPIPLRRHAPRPLKRITRHDLDGKSPETGTAEITATWQAGAPRLAESYAYTRHDSATGQTVTCRVERTAGSVSIDMESKPGS